jgi:tetratricopeptide (TPR) repeat protein
MHQDAMDRPRNPMPQQSQTAYDDPPEEWSGPDSFALAIARLSAGRPLRNRQLQQASVHIDNGRIALAEKELGAYLARREGDPDALFLMARAQLRLGRRREAAALLETCLERAPDFAAARFNYTELLLRLKEFGAALKQIDLLLAADPGNPLFRQAKANVLEHLGESEQSLAICERLVAEDPARTESWISYGHALRAVGRQEESIGAYRRALEQRPSSGMAYWSLANMKTVRFADADIGSMLAQVARPDISADDRIRIQYALGKAYEDRGEYERSFENYAKANAAMRLRIPYDPDNVTRQVAASKAMFTPEFFAGRAGAGNPSRDPIFVVSMPRAGSTLVEQILSSHSMIEGAGELPYITTLVKQLGEFPASLAPLDTGAFAAMGAEYLELARTHRKLGRPHFVDKKPPNFFYLGFIHLILPNAKIVDARRHPAACCLSNFKQYFNKPRPRQAELGRFYRDYVEMMAHYDRVLPGKVHRVIYEEMIADPEAETRRLLEYLELPFEENCLRFYETRRSVRTPSSEQVRKPISGEAVDHWRNYEPWLGPLIRSLGAVFTDYPSVPEELR